MKTYDSMVCEVATKVLNAYEKLIEFPNKENARIWEKYGWAGNCLFCQKFKLSISDPTPCKPCPLFISFPEGCCSYGTAADTMDDLIEALDEINMYNSRGFKKLKKAAFARYTWLIRQLDKSGFEYK